MLLTFVIVLHGIFKIRLKPDKMNMQSNLGFECSLVHVIVDPTIVRYTGTLPNEKSHTQTILNISICIYIEIHNLKTVSLNQTQMYTRVVLANFPMFDKFKCEPQPLNVYYRL